MTTTLAVTIHVTAPTDPPVNLAGYPDTLTEED